MKTKSFVVIVIALLTLSLTLPFESLKADPPRWAPAHGYHVKTRHIYFPQQNFYYDMHRHVYIYLDNGRWVTNVRLPRWYTTIDLFRAPKVELEINSDYPYRDNRRHVEMYRLRNKREYYENRRDDGNRDRDREHDRGDNRGENRGHERGDD